MASDEAVDNYIKECTAIDGGNLQAEFLRISVDLAYWSEIYASASYDERVAHRETARARSKAYLDVREAFAREGVKTTEAMVSARVELSQAVVDAEQAEAEAARHKLRVRGYLDAIRTKKDMLGHLVSSSVPDDFSEPGLGATDAEES